MKEAIHEETATQKGVVKLSRRNCRSTLQFHTRSLSERVHKGNKIMQ